MKRHGHLCLASAALALGAGPLLVGEDTIRFGDPTRGQQLFAAKSCVSCHAVRGAGGRIGPDLGRTTGDSFYEIAANMWNHAGGMGEKMEEFRVLRPVFEGGELADLISFLHFLNYFDEPGDPRVGQVLFSEKHCIRCHRVGSEGADIGPPLDRIPRGESPLRIAEALWNHGPQMMAAIESASLELPKFMGNEIIDLFAFLRSHGERRGLRRFQSPGDPERGRVVFEEKQCSTCHTIFGDEPGVGPDLGLAELPGSVTQIAGRMWNHWPDMAETMRGAGMEVPVFEQDELLDLFAFIYIARYEGATGDPVRGRAVFESKGCTVCHTGEGPEAIGPSLDAIADQRLEAIMQSMWNHAPGMNRVMNEQDLSWVRLEPDELADLLAFLRAPGASVEGR